MSSSTKRLSRRWRICVVSWTALMAFGFGAVAEAAPVCTSTDGSLPPVDCQYVANIHQSYDVLGLTINFGNIAHARFANIVIDDSGNDGTLDTVGEFQTESFDSVVRGRLRVFDGSTPLLDTNVELDALVETKITVSEVGSGFVRFDTEMVSLSLGLGGLPALGSFPGAANSVIVGTGLGETLLTDLGGGEFQVDSFFDIFTQLQIDQAGDGTFELSVDAASEARVTAIGVPEPATVAVFGLGLLGLAGTRRRPTR